MKGKIGWPSKRKLALLFIAFSCLFLFMTGRPVIARLWKSSGGAAKLTSCYWAVANRSIIGKTKAEVDQEWGIDFIEHEPYEVYCFDGNLNSWLGSNYIVFTFDREGNLTKVGTPSFAGVNTNRTAQPLASRPWVTSDARTRHQIAIEIASEWSNGSLKWKNRRDVEDFMGEGFYFDCRVYPIPLDSDPQCLQIYFDKNGLSNRAIVDFFD